MFTSPSSKISPGGGKNRNDPVVLIAINLDISSSFATDEDEMTPVKTEG